ncbi:MAG TPA: hypothetical protein VFV94_06480, partial [Polyangiaceae bacterium]|nr:hypothetical protein [Polyangiaceae bacterium]
MSVFSSCLGHPRIGANRELKRALESHWSGKSGAAELAAVARQLRQKHWRSMKGAGIDIVPSNDFSLYDHVLDTAVLAGAVPERFRRIDDPLARYFAMARGLQDGAHGIDLEALEMTKWFDTNYHYIVPELEPDQSFALDASKPLSELGEARALGIETRPVLLGPVSFLILAKWARYRGMGRHRLELLPDLLPVYEALFAKLHAEGVGEVQLDEPCLVQDLDGRTGAAFVEAFQRLGGLKLRPRLAVTTYFESAADRVTLFASSGCDSLHIDLATAPEQLDAVVEGLASHQTLSLGVVDGRNVWRADLDRAHALVRRAIARLGAGRVVVAPSCSLLHAPVDLAGEHGLDVELLSFCAFARQKLGEVVALARSAGEHRPDSPPFKASRSALTARQTSTRTRNAAVRARAEAVRPELLSRQSPFTVRQTAQRERFALPRLPTTTIGSFPQTAEVRAARADARAGRLAAEAYREFLRRETR